MNDIRISKTVFLPVSDIGFVSVVRDKNFIFEYKHGKARHSFVYVKKGALEYSFKNEKRTFSLSKGEAIFIPKGIPSRATYLEDGTEICVLLFLSDSDDLENPTLMGMQSAFSNITNENCENGFFLSSKVYELLYVLQGNGKSLDIPKKYNCILPALMRLKNHYEENRPIKFYSDLCAMSESNFRRIFREYTGQSPIEYRNEMRIAEAKKRLISGEFFVSEIAYDVGFRNMPFFYEALKKYGEN